jgi:hypothetical protein
MGDYTRDVYEKKKADLLMERDRLEVAPVTASLANQRQRIQTLVDDWPKMTGDERKRMLALIFMEIRADHIDGKQLSVTFKPWPHWEPYVDAVLARKAATEPTGFVSTSERKTGVKHAEVVTARLVQDERGWLRLAG